MSTAEDSREGWAGQKWVAVLCDTGGTGALLRTLEKSGQSRRSWQKPKALVF